MKQFDLLVQQVRGLTKAVQAMQQQPQVSVQLERASSEFQNLTTERATWASHPILPGKGKQKVESPPSDHDSTLRESLPPFHQKTLETHSREDLLDQRFWEMNRWIEELRHAPTAYGEDICTDPPFSQMIMQKPIPPNVKLPQFESYDGPRTRSTTWRPSRP